MTTVKVRCLPPAKMQVNRPSTTSDLAADQPTATTPSMRTRRTDSVDLATAIFGRWGSRTSHRIGDATFAGRAFAIRAGAASRADDDLPQPRHRRAETLGADIAMITRASARVRDEPGRAP